MTLEVGSGVVHAPKFDAANPTHLQEVAGIIQKGGIVAFPFNGIFGLFGDIDNPKAADAIIEAKQRPRDKKLIAVVTPEAIGGVADLSRVAYTPRQIKSLLTDIHALGVILPASLNAPSHIAIGEDVLDRTILTIWTEYKPLRTVVEKAQALGVRGLVGTSANKSGEATHYDPDKLYSEFSTDVNGVVYDRFDHLPIQRRKSTTVVDLTNHSPRLHREGNVSEQEVREALRRNDFPELRVERDVITVRGRD